MASDSHEIRITSDLTENVKHTIEGPPDLDAAIKSHLKALQGEGNIPGTEGAASTKALNSMDQVPSSEAFGPGKRFGGAGNPDPNQVRLGPEPAALNKAIIIGATQADAAPAIMQSGVSNVAGNEASGLLKNFQLITTSVSESFKTLGGVVGGIVGKFFHLLGTAGLLAAGILGLSATLGVATEFLDSLFKGLAKQWEDISPRAQAAKGLAEVELVATRLQTENQVGGTTASVTHSRTDMQASFIRLSATVINVIAPIMKLLHESSAVIMEILNAGLKILNVISYPLQWAIAQFAQFMEFIRQIFQLNGPRALPLEIFKNVIVPSFVHNPDLFHQQGLMPTEGERGDQQHRDNPQLPNSPFGIDI